MKILSMNIKDNPDLTPEQVLHDAGVAKAIDPDFAGFQEIGEKADHAALRKHFPAKDYYHLFPNNAIPLIISKQRFTVVEKKIIKAHDGLAGVSPARYTGYAIVKVRGRPDLPEVVLMNNHKVSAAWSRRKVKDKQWRKTHWNIHFDMDKRLVKSFVDNGYTVIYTGDFNRVRLPKVHPDQKSVGHKLDHILVIPGKNGAVPKIGKRHIYTKKIFTDHKPLWTVVTFTVPKKG